MRRISFILLLVIGVVPSILASDLFHQTVLYRSVDQHGDSITLSGYMSVPTSGQPKGIILIPHYTITSKHQAPSVKPTSEAKFFQDEYVLAIPDYLGYGVTDSLVHPYLAGELTARNCIDMLYGLQPILDSMNCPVKTDSIYIVGYSQGGAVAVWIHYLIEQQYADDFVVKACFAGAGPHDVAATYDDAIKRKKVFMPVVIPMMVIGSDVAYDLHLDYEQFFTPKMQDLYSRYLANKEYSTSDLFFKTSNHCLRHWMSDMALDVTQSESKRLYEALKHSGFVRYPLHDKVADRDTICPNWLPKAQLYVFHSKNDNVVTYHCAEHLRQCLPDLPNIQFDMKRYGSHVMASKRFFKSVVQQLKQMTNE